MALELEIYTGMLTYNNIDFSFMFDGDVLRLIPPMKKSSEVEGWLYQSIGVGIWGNREPFYIKDEFLKGKCNETGQVMVFIPKHHQAGNYNHVLLVEIEAYFIEKFHREWIDRVAFECKELDAIFDAEQCIDNFEWSKDGVISVTTKDFDSTTSEKQMFMVNGIEVSVCFDIVRRRESFFDGNVLTVHSVMYFEFEKTDDFLFIYRLWKLAKAFVRYLCYRDNVEMGKTSIAAPAEGDKHENFAELVVIENIVEEEKKIFEQKRCISQQLISGCEGKLLNDISSGKLYLRHLPRTYADGLRIDASRFVMITAAFEWEFRRCYPEGITKSEQTLIIEEQATNEIQNLINNSQGKLKEKYKFLKKLVKSDSLQSEIIQVGKDYDDIIGNFGRHLYSRNNENLDYKEMGNRLANQRNHFAHGDLDQEFIGNSLLDLIFLEYVIYAMQLKYYGVSDENIRKAINKLFHLNYRL